MRKIRETKKADGPVAHELRRRIALSNRPRLGVGLKQLDEVSSTLAHSAPDRAHFTQNPTRYLQARSVPVSSCEFVKTAGRATPRQTSEVCSVFVTCTSDIAVNVSVRQASCIMFLLDCVVTSEIRAFVIGPVILEQQMASKVEWEQGSSVL